MFETEIFEAFGMDIESGDHGLQPTPRPSSYIPVKSILFRYAEYGKVCVFYNRNVFFHRTPPVAATLDISLK